MRMQFVMAILLGIFCIPAGKSSGVSEPHCYPFDYKYEYDGNWFTPDAWNEFDGKLVNDANIADGQLWLPNTTNQDYMDLSYFDFFNGFTIEAEVNIPASQASIQTIIANTGSTADSDGFKLFVNSFASPGNWEICFESGNGQSYSGKQIRTPAHTFTPGRWEHIKVTVTPGGFVIIYLNYEPCDPNYDPDAKASGLAATDFARTGKITNIGRMTNGTWYMHGFIRNLCISEWDTMRPSGDLDDSCIVDDPDLVIFIEQWLQSPSCPSADIFPSGGDGIVDLIDFAEFAGQWLMREPM